MARRFVGGLVAVLLLGGLPSDSGAKKRPRAPRGLGVFATIGGKRFKAPSTGLGDRCVKATYLPASGGVIVSAGECRGTGRHRRAKHNPKVVALVCGVATATSPPVPPFDATYVRGTFTGIFDTPQQAGAPAAVAIDGAGSFYLAVTIGN